jgi:Domain of unknown function (DUF4911)
MPDHGTRAPGVGRRSDPPAASLGRPRGSTSATPCTTSADRVAPLLLDEVSRGMVVRRMSVAPSEVVFVKGIVEASDGVAAVFAESGGEISIVSPLGREAELAELLHDLSREIAPSRALSAPGSDLDLPHAGVT